MKQCRFSCWKSLKMKKVLIPINACDSGRISATVLAGYYKFATATITRGFNGATAILEVYEDGQVKKGGE